LIDYFDHENFGDGHGQNWLDYFDPGNSILAKWSKIVVIGPPEYGFYHEGRRNVDGSMKNT
jgi:hypothetical protein